MKEMLMGGDNWQIVPFLIAQTKGTGKAFFLIGAGTVALGVNNQSVTSLPVKRIVQ